MAHLAVSERDCSQHTAGRKGWTLDTLSAAGYPTHPKPSLPEPNPERALQANQNPVLLLQNEERSTMWTLISSCWASSCQQPFFPGLRPPGSKCFPPGSHQQIPRACTAYSTHMVTVLSWAGLNAAWNAKLQWINFLSPLWKYCYCITGWNTDHLLKFNW